MNIPEEPVQANATTVFDTFLAEDHVIALRQATIYRVAWRDAQTEIRTLKEQVTALQQELASSPAQVVTTSE